MAGNLGVPSFYDFQFHTTVKVEILEIGYILVKFIETGYRAYEFQLHSNFHCEENLKKKPKSPKLYLISKTFTFILCISEILRNWVFSKKAISGKMFSKQEKCPQFL